jgi:CCR4-NOT complex subunit CAF16
MRNGSFVVQPSSWPLCDSDFEAVVASARREGVSENEIDTIKAGSSLHSIAIMWLAEDRKIRIKEEQEGKREKKRGARSQVYSPSISFTSF